MPFPVCLGWDPREDAAFRVARHSLHRHATVPVRVFPVVLRQLQDAGLYSRPMERRDGLLWDSISGAPCATEFAISRFFLPYIVNRGMGPRAEGFALFADGDVLFRRDVAELATLADPRFAVQVVRHNQAVGVGERKMEGQPQLPYARKNWSSVMLWNLDHPAHRRLTLHELNTWPGRDLHAFRWLDDADVGELPQEWNWLEGHSDPGLDPALVHLTRGGPWLPDWQHVEYAGEWLAEAGRVLVADTPPPGGPMQTAALVV